MHEKILTLRKFDLSSVPIPNSNARNIAGVAIVNNNKVLLVQEGQEHCYGQWNFPAGHIDEGENPPDAAAREAFEESGYNVELTGKGMVYDLLDQRGHLIEMFLFLSKIMGGEPKVDGKEILSLKWFSADEIDNMEDTELRNSYFVRQVFEDIRDLLITN